MRKALLDQALRAAARWTVVEMRVLKYFLEVAREENITRAARRLHITQPTLSRQLMQLEEELGATLFQRNRHRITLTDEGLLLKRRAGELIALAEKTARELSPKSGGIMGDISIGCGETRSMDVLSRLLVPFHALHPQVRYEIHSANADDIKERIENGLLDLGLLVEPVDIGRYGFLRMPCKEAWGLMVAEESPLAAKTEIHPSDLADIPLLVTNRALVQNELAAWFGGSFDGHEIAAAFNLSYNAAILVRNGAGAALCLDLECRYDGVRFIPLEPPLETGSVLVWKKDQTLPGAVGALLEHIRNAF